MTTPLQFRPHHFLCANGFEGKGYSPDFVYNFADIVAELRGPQGDQVLLQVVTGADDICQPCPHRREKSCTKQALIESLDQRHLEALRLTEKQVLSWGHVKERIKSYVSDSVFDSMCRGCGWQSEGMCLKALQQLRHNKTVL